MTGTIDITDSQMHKCVFKISVNDKIFPYVFGHFCASLHLVLKPNVTVTVTHEGIDHIVHCLTLQHVKC